MYDGIVKDNESGMEENSIKDNESGMEENSMHHKTGEEAIEHALRKLKRRLHDEGVVNIHNK